MAGGQTTRSASAPQLLASTPSGRRSLPISAAVAVQEVGGNPRARPLVQRRVPRPARPLVSPMLGRLLATVPLGRLPALPRPVLVHLANHQAPRPASGLRALHRLASAPPVLHPPGTAPLGCRHLATVPPAHRRAHLQASVRPLAMVPPVRPRALPQASVRPRVLRAAPPVIPARPPALHRPASGLPAHLLLVLPHPALAPPALHRPASARLVPRHPASGLPALHPLASAHPVLHPPASLRARPPASSPPPRHPPLRRPSRRLPLGRQAMPRRRLPQRTARASSSASW